MSDITINPAYNHFITQAKAAKYPSDARRLCIDAIRVAGWNHEQVPKGDILHLILNENSEVYAAHFDTLANDTNVQQTVRDTYREWAILWKENPEQAITRFLQTNESIETNEHQRLQRRLGLH